MAAKRRAAAKQSAASAPRALQHKGPTSAPDSSRTATMTMGALTVTIFAAVWSPLLLTPREFLHFDDLENFSGRAAPFLHQGLTLRAVKWCLLEANVLGVREPGAPCLLVLPDRQLRGAHALRRQWACC
jgi:hypothetical protein